MHNGMQKLWPLLSSAGIDCISSLPAKLIDRNPLALAREFIIDAFFLLAIMLLLHSVLHSSGCSQSRPPQQRVVSRSSSSFLALSMWITLSMAAWQTGSSSAQQQPATDAAEQSALLDVLVGINSEFDWQSQVPDACIGNQRGVFCEVDANDNSVYHITSLEFGSVFSEYSTESLIPCSGNATLDPSISKLSFLRTLVIYNCFQNDSSTSIPREIGLLSASLQILTVQGNPGLGGVLPAELGNLTHLQRLVLTENEIGGVIPEELGDLLELRQLDLSENELQGSIPESLSSLQSLVILDLGWNSLSGAIPSMSGLSELEQLALGHNDLSGSIPCELGNLSALVYLDLSYNRLSAGIPSSFTSLGKLRDLFLNSNSMQSETLPDYLGSIETLTSLTLSDSGYTGEIPPSLGRLRNLRVLSMGSNNFWGPLPASLGRLPNIYVLDLSSNNLTGAIPFSPSFVARMGSNLMLMNNIHLCVNPSNLQRAMEGPGLNLRLCNESMPKSVLEISVSEAGFETGKPHLSHGSAGLQYCNQMEVTIIIVLLAFTSWQILLTDTIIPDGY